MKDVVTPFGGHRNGERARRGRRRTKQVKSGGPTQDEGGKKHRGGGGGGASGDVDDDVTDLITQVHHEELRDLESATYCTLFQPRDSAIVINMQDAGRAYNEMVVNSPDTSGSSW